MKCLSINDILEMLNKYNTFFMYFMKILHETEYFFIHAGFESFESSSLIIIEYVN